jgi:hypothetical protein
MAHDSKNSPLVPYSKLLLITLLLLHTSCISTTGKSVYESTCSSNLTFKKVKLRDLIDSVNYYNGKYVEVSGIFRSDLEESALYDDAWLIKKEPEKAVWIQFASECPLRLTNSEAGCVFVPKFIADKPIIVKGKLDTSKGHLGQYACTVTEIHQVMAK